MGNQAKCWSCGGWFDLPSLGDGSWGGFWFFEGERSERKPEMNSEADEYGPAGCSMSAAHCRRCARAILGLPPEGKQPPRAKRDDDMTPLPRTKRQRRKRTTKGDGF